MKILFFGDIVGKIGRKAMIKILPEMKAEYQPDLIIANGENLAHGTGATPKTIKEMQAAGIDYFTSGNHIFDKPEAEVILNDPQAVILRPANYFNDRPGAEYKIIEIGSKRLLLVSLLGRVFMKDTDTYGDPFKKIDEILVQTQKENLAGIIVDLHAEATSEKVAMGWYLDGRVSAVLGTHTHVPTADERILPQGTAFISDIGMVGAADSVIGVDKEEIIKSFLANANPKNEIPEEGEVIINAVYLEIDPATKKALNIARVDKKTAV
jgi:hypothetical protein